MLNVLLICPLTVSVALKAYNTAIIPKNQAEAAYQLGRYYHALDEKNPSEKVNTQNVYKYYNMALQKWPENPLIQYGVAQSLIQQGMLSLFSSFVFFVVSLYNMTDILLI